MFHSMHLHRQSAVLLEEQISFSYRRVLTLIRRWVRHHPQNDPRYICMLRRMVHLQVDFRDELSELLYDNSLSRWL